MKINNNTFWLKISGINFLLIAIVGVIMRYKICFDFPFLNQKYLQLAHSNFAFTGWVTQTLFLLMIQYVKEYINEERVKKYQNILIANVLVSFGLFISFAFQGYGLTSIFISTLSIIIGFIFAILFYIDSKNIKQSISLIWFQSALFFMLISSIGTFSIAYMMAVKHVIQHEYLASIYWYLHFQYNGWFYFAGVGLLLNLLKQYIAPSNNHTITFMLFGISCLATYILSILWLNLSLGWLIVAFLSATIQLIAWFRLLHLVKKPLYQFLETKTPILKYILLLLAIAITIKFVLQLGSTFPMVSKLAFGFRPVVIAYLHLVLLTIISVFLILLIWLNGSVIHTKFTIGTILFFVLMIYLNQLVLGIQGIASFANYYFKFINETLLTIAISIVISILFIILSLFKKHSKLDIK